MQTTVDHLAKTMWVLATVMLLAMGSTGCVGLPSSSTITSGRAPDTGAVPDQESMATNDQATLDETPGDVADEAPADRRSAQRSTEVPSSASKPAVRATVRGQTPDAGRQLPPGSGNYWRGPMPVSGAPTAGDSAGGNDTTAFAPPPASTTAGTTQPAATPPAATPHGAAGPNVNSDQWISNPLMNSGLTGTLPSSSQLPGTPVPVDIYVEEDRTGRFMFGAGLNSEAGVTGQIIIDERNFDLFKLPRNFDEIWNGEAFRGAGQGFRIEAIPGNQVQRYLASFTEPYLLSTPVSLNVSGFLFDRFYYDWTESRIGGRVGLGYRLTPDLSVAAALRMEDVQVRSPRVRGVAPLESALGHSDLYSGRFTIRHDTRDIPFAPTEGHLIEMSFEQVFGEYDYPRADVDLRRYFLVRERADGSGRHTLALSLGAGFTGSQTPIFENYYAGGFSTLRGFQFRGASPIVSSVTVGGQFRLLGSVEYMLPLTADDMIKAVAFCDYGTVEQDIALHGDSFRVAPGFGFRLSIPAMGPAPLAFDFAFPISKADGDRTRTFSFFFGYSRG